eukprot:GFUD01023715.1.p1 GENE.GFUD01023715.1~~GFUD01023715.1.p1  ORF type:complete len:192 (-),score=26.52 GFUD01023715.1:1111-1686(-)
MQERVIIVIVATAIGLLRFGDAINPRQTGPRRELTNGLPLDIKKSNQIALLPYIAKVYSVSFDVIINNLGTARWNSIIHLTIGADISVYGDRTPAVWLNDGKGFYICSAINGNKDKCYVDPIQREVGVWYHIEISQSLTGNKLMYAININQETVYTIENTQAEQFEKVQVWAGDEYYAPLDGKIRNIEVKT